jgi:hypothetical protein
LEIRLRLIETETGWWSETEPGIVPPDSFPPAPRERVEIAIDVVGVLANQVEER